MYNVTRVQPETSAMYAAVEVEPVRVHTRDGDVVEVTGFWLNGPAWPSTRGYKIKKDGTRGAVKMQNLSVPVPDAIVAQMRAVTLKESA